MMVIDAGFTSEMLALLATMRKKTFKSFECTSLDGFGTFPCNFRLNLGRFAVDVSCDLHPLEGQPAGFDEMTWFSCAKADLKSEFQPGIVAEPRQYLVDEVITGVEVVHDRVEHDGGVVVEADMALVIRTKYHTFTFSRDIWFDDTIAIDISAPGSEPQGIKPAEELWFDDERHAIATRTTRVL